MDRGHARRDQSDLGREFYGHGAFSPDGSTLYATESIIDEDYRGVVVVRDAKTLEEIGISLTGAFRDAGGEELVVVPCLNDHPAWISALAEIVAG